MKIIQINDAQLEVNQSGIGSVIGGIIFILFGIGTALTPLFLTGAAWWVSLIGVGIILIGVLMTLTAKNRHISLLKTGTSTVTETKVIGGKSQTVSFDASQVVSVGLETRTQYTQNTSSSSNSSTPQRQRVSTLFVSLRDNSQILLATSKQNMNRINIGGINMSSFGAAPLSKEANQISLFFSVPLSSSDQGAIGLENIGRIIGGIKNGFESSPQPPIVNPTQPSAIQSVTMMPPQPAALVEPSAAGSSEQPLPTATPPKGPLF